MGPANLRSLRGNAIRQIGEVYTIVNGLMRLYGSLSPYVARQIQAVGLAARMALKRKALGESPDGRKDSMTHMLKTTRDGEPGFSDIDLNANAVILVTTGSETTSAGLTGAIFNLGLNPQAFKILADEVRSAFKTDQDIHMNSTARLPYLIIVIEDTLRITPASSEIPPRLCPVTLSTVNSFPNV